MNRAQKIIANIFGIKAGSMDAYENMRQASFQIVNGQIISSEDNKQSYLTNGLLINDIIYSITKAIQDKIRIAEWEVYKIEDESSLKEYRSIVRKKDWSAGDYQKAVKLQKKALAPVNAGKPNELLSYPNEYCGFSDIVADSSLFKMITGGRMIYGTRLDDGFNKGKIQYINHLPYHLAQIVASTSFPMEELGYYFSQLGILQDKAFKKEDVLHDKFFNPDYNTDGRHLYGLAPLKAALKLTDRSNSSNKAATAAFQNGGPKVLAFMDDERVDKKIAEKQAQELKKIMQGKEYTGPDNANKPMFSGYKMGVVPLGLSPVELGLIESEKWDLRRFCNVWGAAPSQVFNDPDNKVYNNTKEGEKAFTSRCALPYLNTFANSFNRKLADWGLVEKGKGIIVDYDVSCYHELQEDMKEKSTWVMALPVQNRYKLEMLDLDFDEKTPGLDEVWIPSNMQNIETANMVDQTLNDPTNDPTAD